MNRRSLSFLCFAMLVVFAAALTAHAQRRGSHGVVHNMSAWVDTNSGAHPDKFTVTGPALITCARATSEVSNPVPRPGGPTAATASTGTLPPGRNPRRKPATSH